MCKDTTVEGLEYNPSAITSHFTRGKVESYHKRGVLQTTHKMSEHGVDGKKGVTHCNGTSRS